MDEQRLLDLLDGMMEPSQEDFLEFLSIIEKESFDVLWDVSLKKGNSMDRILLSALASELEKKGAKGNTEIAMSNIVKKWNDGK